MEDSYTLEKGSFSFYGDGCADEFFEKLENNSTFHVGQVYEEVPAKKLICSKCGNSEFNVGQGSFFTAIKCVTCKWERCIHEG